MKEINPLEERLKRNQDKRFFRITLGVMVVLSMLIVLAAGFWFSSELDNFAKRLESAEHDREELLKKIDQQGQAINQLAELNTCLLVVHIPEHEFPGADREICHQRITSFNNSDGTFLSREADGTGTPQFIFNPVGQTNQGPQGPSGPQGPPGETPQQPVRGLVDDVLNTIGNIL